MLLTDNAVMLHGCSACCANAWILISFDNAVITIWLFNYHIWDLIVFYSNYHETNLDDWSLILACKLTFCCMQQVFYELARRYGKLVGFVIHIMSDFLSTSQELVGKSIFRMTYFMSSRMWIYTSSVILKS